MSDFEEEIKLAFLDEADDAVKEAERLIIVLERDSGKTSAIDELFRVMHSFKGSSAGAGFAHLSLITHAAESFMILLKQKKLTLTPKSISTLLACNDHLATSVAKLRLNLAADVSNSELITKLESLMKGEDSTRLDVATKESSASTSSVTEVVNTTESVQVAGAVQVAEGANTEVGSAVAPAASAKKMGVESIRVPLPKIEQLLNEIGELVILQTVMSQNRKLLGNPFLKNTVLQMEKLIRNVQANSMSLRMLSIKPLFQRLERIVRDTSTALEKEIEFTTKGENNEIDKTMLEQVSDPLVHIVRNSVDHGIESPEERLAAGKPKIGKIVLLAFQQGDRMVIEVRDDGKGLDPKKILASAVKKGLVSADSKLTDAEARNLIFLPGFSTKSEVTDLSGRGVGMDVVQTNINELQGRVELSSEVGVGTTIQIFLPLTLAIIEGIVVQICEQRFVVPLSQIVEYHQPKTQSISMISERSEVLLLRGESIPILRLDHIMHLQSGALRTALNTVIIVHTLHYGKVALMVDRVLRQQQIVIKQLSPELRGHPGIMGGAVLGDGRVAMILDVVDWAERHLKNNDAGSVTKHKQAEVG